MSLVIFGIGVLVFFLTVYGTVVAGGLLLTKQQLETNSDLAADLGVEKRNTDDGLSSGDVIRSEF